MLRFIATRLIGTIPVVFVLSLGVFLMLHLTPGDPVQIMLGQDADPQSIAALRSQLGLDQPLPVQYVRWAANALRGDLGRSIRTNEPVTEAIVSRLPVTIELSLIALLISLAIGLPVGVLAATHRNGSLDLTSTGVALLGVSLPNFFLGILLILVFAQWLRWVPPSGYTPMLQDPLMNLKQMFMPCLALGAALAGIVARLMRSSLLDVLDADYMRTARSKGLVESAIIVGHGLRNRSEDCPRMKRLPRMRLARVGGVLVLMVIIAAVSASVATPYSPTQQDITNLLRPPSPTHPLGTDELGRDTLTRVMFGAQASLQVGIIAVGISLVVGSVLGLVAGYLRGLTDSTLMRIMDGLLALPTLVLALAITAMLGPGLNNAMLAIGVTGAPVFARLVRGQVLAVRELDYVQAARSLGAGHVRMIRRHIQPNVSSPIVVQASLAMPTAILAEAGLSFLGLGVQPPTPSWGGMLNTAKGYLQQDPWLAIAPGVAIFVTVLGFNFLGDALRDALDPRLRRMAG